MLLPFRWFRRRATRKSVRLDRWTRLTVERLEERIVPSLQAVFDIPPNPPPAQPGYLAYDNVSPITITVRLEDSTRVLLPSHQQPVSVQYYTSDGSGAQGAVQGTDYVGVAANSTLAWGSNDNAPKT